MLLIAIFAYELNSKIIIYSFVNVYKHIRDYETITNSFPFEFYLVGSGSFAKIWKMIADNIPIDPNEIPTEL